MSLKDIVHQHPSHVSSMALYTSKKQTSLLAIHPLSGRVVASYGSVVFGGDLTVGNEIVVYLARIRKFSLCFSFLFAFVLFVICFNCLSIAFT